MSLRGLLSIGLLCHCGALWEAAKLGAAKLSKLAARVSLVLNRHSKSCPLERKLSVKQIARGRDTFTVVGWLICSVSIYYYVIIMFIMQVWANIIKKRRSRLTNYSTRTTSQISIEADAFAYMHHTVVSDSIESILFSLRVRKVAVLVLNKPYAPTRTYIEQAKCRSEWDLFHSPTLGPSQADQLIDIGSNSARLVTISQYSDLWRLSWLVRYSCTLIAIWLMNVHICLW